MAQERVVTLRNLSAHVKVLNLGRGVTIKIPPTPDGHPGTTITLQGEDEAQRFERALALVKAEWVDSGELVVADDGTLAPSPPPAAPKPPPPPPSEPPPPPPSRSRRE